MLPDWFANALRADRKSLLKSDAFRSFAFMAVVFVFLYFNLQKKLSPYLFYAFLAFIIMIDLVVVDKRYFVKENYKRKREAIFTPRPSEKQIIEGDKSYYRVLSDEMDGRASYFFNSVLGYHGAILKRYENLQDSALFQDVREFFTDGQQQKFDYSKYGIINMLNCKYILFGEEEGQFVLNRGAAGPAWFIREIVPVNSPTEELAQVEEIDTRRVAVIDITKFNAPTPNYDSASSIKLTERKPNYMKYEAETQTNNVAVFSEIYYAAGWSATIDGKETPILRVNYVLRALEIPAGKHTIEFRFAPKPYTIGNPITTASSWIMLIVLLGSIGWSLRKERD
jgi:hypothetical protein